MKDTKLSIKVREFFKEKDSSIEELKGKRALTHKALYFTYGEIIKNTSIKYNNDSEINLSYMGDLIEFEAWRYGPVIYDVYKKHYNDSNWINKVNIDEHLHDTFAEKLYEFSKMDEFKLIDMSHKKGTPWYTLFVEGVKRTSIPDNLIKEFFKNEKLNNSN